MLLDIDKQLIKKPEYCYSGFRLNGVFMRRVNCLIQGALLTTFSDS